MFQALIKRSPDFLDHPLADLLPMRFMGEVAVNAYRGLIKRLKDLPLSMKEKEARLRDGQDAGKALLMIEAKIGELTIKEPQEHYQGIPKGDADAKNKPLKYERLGMTRAQMHRAQAIHTHPKEVAEIIKEAEENEDIPTKTAVLNKIALKQANERAKNRPPASKLRMVGEAFVYYSKLTQACALIPAEPPQDVTEKDFLEMRAMWLLIFKKGKPFSDLDQKTREDYAADRKRLAAGEKS